MALTERFGVSERRACNVVGQHRSTQRRCPEPTAPEEDKLRHRLRQIAKRHTRWGWRKAHQLLLREGWRINRKRTRRIWREEGLRRPATCRKHRRVRLDCPERLSAAHPNHVWAIDFQFDETADLRRLKLLNIVDEFTREALAMRVGRTCTADELVSVIEALVIKRGAPGYLRMDNGPELVAWALRDWCRMAGTGTLYIEPGSRAAPYVESSMAESATSSERRGVRRPDRGQDRDRGLANGVQHLSASLISGGLTPAEFARRWAMDHQPALS